MKSDSLAKKAYTEIRRKILSAQLPSSTRFKEDEWAKKTSASRMAVREALTRLLGEGLLVFGEKGGYFLKPMTEADVHQIRELREILELGALRLAFKKMGKDEYTALDKICNDFTNMVKEEYFNGALEADIKFHETLMEFSGNEKLLNTYHTSHIPLFHQKIGKTQIGLNDAEQTDLEHRQLVKALKSKNLKLAEETLTKHFARGEALALDLD
ncbi:MAG: GntR family transcriptional regulator [Ferruginibacter sp.]